MLPSPQRSPIKEHDPINDEHQQKNIINAMKTPIEKHNQRPRKLAKEHDQSNGAH
jgi:hypothetical protein